MKNIKISFYIVILLSIVVIILSITGLVSGNYNKMPIVLGLLAIINIINGVRLIKEGKKTPGWTTVGAGIFIFLVVIMQLLLWCS